MSAIVTGIVAGTITVANILLIVAVRTMNKKLFQSKK